MTHNIVDKFVKKSILSYFGIFPSRIHVLQHALLGNGTGFEWRENSDGWLVLENRLKETRDRDSIEQYEGDSGLENVVRDWINDNIDDYCCRWFHYAYIDLRPKRADNLLSRGFNRLEEIEDMSKVHPDWREAIEEVCEYFMQVLAPAGCVYISRDTLDVLRGEHRESYLILFNTYEAIHNRSEARKNLASRLLDKVLSEDPDYKSPAELRQEGWESDFKDKIGFDEYNSLYDWFKARNMGLSGHREIQRNIKRHLNDVDKFYTNGELNDHFYSEVNRCLGRVGWQYFDEGSITSQVAHMLKTSPKMKSAVRKAVSEEICQIVGS